MHTQTVLAFLLLLTILSGFVKNYLFLIGSIHAQGGSTAMTVFRVASIVALMGWGGIILLLIIPSGSDTILSAVRCVFGWPTG